MTEEKAKHIVRIANTDVTGSKSILIAMTKIKGIGFIFSNAVCKAAHVNKFKKAGLLDLTEVDRIQEVIANPGKYNIPSWMFNRKYDIEAGETKHIISGDLTFAVSQDIRRMQKIRSYKGVRHNVGLTVRGQRTKSNFRRNKGKAVGVKKKKDAAK
ncbi:MAG: 30S ribosomal protein S13 [Candidatus Woesearchaeota archaeon]|nr:30S ribosomal protein S13 [Candidatus Woesearchaeota archaeon]